MRKNYRKYNGFSLIELLLTTMILTVIMLLVATTLNTVIKVSNTTNSKNTARANMSYVMDYISRALTNSELGDIYLFNSVGVRTIGEGISGQLAVLSPLNLQNAYLDGKLGDETLRGNEIHIKLYGYNDWTCIGYFKDESGYGYLVRTVYEDDMQGDHSLCFSESAIVTPMHLVMGDNENRMFLINSTLRPLYWPVGDTFPINKDVTRQAVVSTQALTWY